MDNNYINKLNTIKSFGECFDEALTLAGIKAIDIARQLDIDKTVITRVVNGNRHLPPDKIAQFCKIVGNTLLIDWLCHQCGGRFMKNTEQLVMTESAIEAIVDKRMKRANQELISVIKDSLEHGNSEALRMISEKLNPDESTN